MADVQHNQFLQRLSRIGEFHRQMALGHVAAMNPDGLVVAQPVKPKSNSTARSLFLCLVIMWAFKIYLHASIGATAYQERITLLQDGSVIQRVGAFVMAADPVTVWIAGLAGPTK